MAASVINPSDIGFIRGSSEYARPLPVTPGAEGSGTIIAAGDGWLGRFLLGRRAACGRAATGDGTWAQYLLTRASNCVPLGRQVTFEQGATLLVNPMSGIAFMDMIRSGRHTAVVNNAAASQLGRMLLRLCQKAGVPLINIVRDQKQAAMLKGMGAEYVLVSSEPGFDAELKALASRLRATLFLDAVGGDFTQRMVDASPDGSRIVLYANLERKPAPISPNSVFHHDRHIEGFYMPLWAGKQGMIKMLMSARKAQRLATHETQTPFQNRMPLASAQEALELYQSDMTAGKVLLVIDPGAVALE
jgi:NADPH:quinone reductase-like Zn-dependent oxidoreductase